MFVSVRSAALRSFMLCLPAIGGLAVIAACATSSTRDGFDNAQPSSSSGATSSSGSSGEQSSGFGGGGVDAASNSDGCSEEAKLVYVLSLEGDLYSFAPADKKFTKVGPLNCKSGNTKFIPISMAVDRNAVAWVNMREDTILGGGEDTMFKVDTKTAKCEPTAIHGAMGGMGFSTNDGSNKEETLYVIGAGTPSGLGFKPALVRVDFAGQALVPVADLQEQVDLELTGTGDGRLYGFLIDTPLALAKVDKKTSAFSDKVTLASVEHPLAPMFAFSFWGGDFYFYTATDQSSSKTTNVTRYRPSDGSIDTKYMQNIGFHIVGAGVSTCAPVSVPK